MIINLNVETDKDLIKLILQHLEDKIETTSCIEQPKPRRGRPRLYPAKDPNEPKKPRGRPRKIDAI
jgi:hypothetical protein